jgi:UDP-N-acetylglucosamine--N-acetylmuramyl-(pentapeptide) pyrophosphoryl-undecaprenol N-acetylglucosamine transferase
MTRPTRILLTGGGTAGHVNPALAIGRALAADEGQLLYVGVRGRAEAEIVPREGIPIRFVRASAYPGSRPSMALFRFLGNLSVGIFQACAILLRFRPQMLVGTGGFASAPVLLAAAFLRRARLTHAKIFVHEQNAAPGKLNQLVGRLADCVFVTFPQTQRHFPGNAVVAGYPLRRRIARVDRDYARARLDFAVPPGRQVVFAFGGSQGARAVNRAIVDALGHLLPIRDRLFIVHGTGLSRKGDYDAASDTRARLESRYTEAERGEIAAFYVSRPFFYQIENVFALADLAVTRGGAGSLYELASLGLPAIIIPKSNLPGDHQVMNARAMERCGGAVVIYEEAALTEGQIVEQVDGRMLADTIAELLADPHRLTEMGRRSHAFSPKDALAIIERRIAGGEDASAPADTAGNANQAGEAGATAEDALPSNHVLLGLLEQAEARNGAPFRPESVVPSAGDRAYFVSRAASLLVSAEWEHRNLGVKLIGLLHARDKTPLLLALLNDRRPAPLIKRLFGGDFVQVGFIRRNIVTALGRLGEVSPEVQEALLAAFDDPYFEVRAEAARTAARLAVQLTDRAGTVAALRRRLSDRWLEVAGAAAQALGKVGHADDALPALLSLQDARLWRLRAAALEGLLSLVERGESGDPAALVDSLNRFVLTSTDFKPEFQIKRLYGRVLAAVATREGGVR